MRWYLLTTFLVFFLGVNLSARASEPPISNHPLVNQEGKPFQLYDLKGKYVFVSFIFTRCPLPKMCPLTMTLNQQLYRKWKMKASALPLHFLIVTLDPAVDTPVVLKKFGQSRRLNFSHFTLATGNPQVLSDFAGNFNVIGIPSEGSVSHNLKSVLLAPNMVPLKEYKENEWEPEQILKDMRAAQSTRG